MTDEEELMLRHLKDLADKSYANNHYTFTEFLSLADQSLYYEHERDLKFAGVKIYGGAQGTERNVIRFGDPENLGYEEDFPISIISITPISEKFADDLTHRDFLGALMNLGIKREVLGDLFIKDNKAYLFALNKMAGFITDNLTKVRHTTCLAKEITELPMLAAGEGKEKLIQVASPRIDGVVAKVYNLSRGDAAEAFRARKVFLNGRLTENVSAVLKSGDTVTVRGFGKFILKNEGGLSRKGKTNLNVEVF
ncbi:MAG: hypothetical protein IKS09_01550 [Lachnospiraceae bacterium]|nr:hypothetical protein [Lachnospiraceae bacterium]